MTEELNFKMKQQVNQKMVTNTCWIKIRNHIIIIYEKI